MKPHRIYTLFRNLALTLIPVFATLLSGGKGWLFVATFFLSVAAVVLALVFPVRQDEPIDGPCKVFFGLFGGLGLLVFMGFMLVAGVISVEALTSGTVDLKCATYTELTGHRIACALYIDDMIPPEACEIQFKGFGGGVLRGIGRHADFSCTVTEPDFLRFASVHEYALETNRFVNVNTVCNPDGTSSGWESYRWAMAPEPERYLTYQNIYRNGGGITLAFDLSTGILRGHYSSN